MTASRITVRTAQMSDHDIIALFNRNLASETEGKSLDPATVHAGVHAILSDRAKGIYYVAEIEARVVGQLMVTYEWSDWRNGTFWWVQSVFVTPECRGQGVFTALMKHLTSETKRDAGCCGMRLYVHHDNRGALTTYRKFGFTKLDYQLYERSPS